MNIKNTVLSVFNVKKGEVPAIVLLMLYSFFIGASIAFYYVTTTSLFLESNKSTGLPLAYIGGGVIAFIFWLLYSRLERWMKFSKLLIFGVLFLILSVGIFAFSHNYMEVSWLPYLMFIWIRIFMFVQYVGFWGMAQRMFDLRQGKRLFGLISSGEVISDIIGFFSIPLILEYISTDDILYISLLLLFVSLMVLVTILIKYRPQLSAKTNFSSDEPEKNQNEEKSSANLPLKKYYFLISLLALIPMFGICFADYAFLNQSEVHYQDTDVMTGFLGYFYGIIAVAEFVVRTFISGRLLSKYGLKVGLAVMPVILAISTLLASLSGTIYGTMAMFFSFIALTRLLERVLRTAIYDPSYQILYQPLPKEGRLMFQGRIEGIAKASGNVIAGLVLFAFISFESLNIIHFNYLFLIILILWSNMSFRMYRQYRKTLKLLVSSQKDLVKPEFMNEKILNIRLNKMLLKTEVKNFDYTMALLDKFAPGKTEPVIRKLLQDGTREVKIKILDKISNKDLIFSSKFLEQCMMAEEAEVVVRKFEDQVEMSRRTENLPLDYLSELSKSEDPDDREYSAKLLRYSGRYNSYKILNDLLHDDVPYVKKAALISSGKIKRHELWANLIDNLQTSEFNNTAAYAITLTGYSILNELDLYFNKYGTDKKTRIEIIRLYSKIGGQRALDLLREKIDFPDKEIRDEVLISLNKLSYKASVSEKPFIKQAIDEEIEIIVWIMAALIDLNDDPQTINLQIALEHELYEKKQHIFLLLSMIYDAKTINHILQNIQDGSKESRVYAIEIFDLIVSPDIKEKMLHLLEDQNYADCIAGFSDSYPQEHLNKTERLIDIINKDYTKINRWTKVCAIEMLDKYPDPENIQILQANMINPDPVISETASFALYRLNKDKYRKYLAKVNTYMSGIQDITEKMVRDKQYIPIIDKVKLLKNTKLFEFIPEILITDVAAESESIYMQQHEELNLAGEHKNCFYLLINGQIDVVSNEKVEGIYKNDSVIIHMPEVESLKIEYQYRAAIASMLLKIDIDVLDDLDLITDNYDIIIKLISIINSQNNADVENE